MGVGDHFPTAWAFVIHVHWFVSMVRELVRGHELKHFRLRALPWPALNLAARQGEADRTSHKVGLVPYALSLTRHASVR